MLVLTDTYKIQNWLKYAARYDPSSMYTWFISCVVYTLTGFSLVRDMLGY
jgi:hypothetical protein